MKTADEMFEGLGYKKYRSKDKTRIKYIFEGSDVIEFNISFKLVNSGIFNGTSPKLSKNIDIQELQAINKKCQELGWI